MNATTRVGESIAAPMTLYVALDLGSTKWTIGSTTDAAQRPRVKSIAAGDVAALQREINAAKARFGLPAEAPVQSCYEAGRDGFWLHRWLASQGVSNIVVDSSSIEVNRRARRAKTDQIDVGRLLQLLWRWARGERRVWSVVQVPTPTAEDHRQLPREIATVREDRKRLRNRIQGLLITQGIRLGLGSQFLKRVRLAQTGDGRPLPDGLIARLEREWGQLRFIQQRLMALKATQARQVATGTDRVATVARQLCLVRGVAETSALLFSTELFGTREFHNRREVAALTGLAPVPYRSDQSVRDQGISKAGRTELRRVAVQLGWGWLRWQRDSALTKWFHQRFGHAGGRSRRIGIVAVARKLLIALWHFVTRGVVPDGAALKGKTMVAV